MAKNLFTLLSFIFLSIPVLAMPLYTRKEIKLHVEKKLEHRSATAPFSIQAFINNSQLEIRIDPPIEGLIISIIDSITGEVIYYNATICSQALVINLLDAKQDSQYIIEFYTANSLIIKGEFTLN